MRHQIALAKKFGVHGFCFHYYWFSGRRRLLERPVEQFLADPTLDIPFCLCWANENWSRRWDGMEQEVLMRQEYHDADDSLFVSDLIRHFQDPRYLRVEGRPVFVVYRASAINDMKGTLKRWRDGCLNRGERDPYFIMAQSFDIWDPAVYGFDAAVQFPPHSPKEQRPFPSLNIRGTVRGFMGGIADYQRFRDTVLDDYDPLLPSYPCVVPGWDNTARRKLRSFIVADSSPVLYGEWLKKAGTRVIECFPPERRFVFLNAWNEWAEGAYLEPDLSHGYAYLNATARALSSLAISDEAS